jgi:5-hydroxyisourate hydrolase
MGGRLTTHVLDISRGIPAAGMKIELWRYLKAGTSNLLLSFETNQDGRTEFPLLVKEMMQSGEYELIFEVGAYYRAQDQLQAEPLFLDHVPVRFHIHNPEMHYHVPLLVAPGGYSTYRGS